MTPIQDLHLHVLETAPSLHPERRARIYRALAEIIGDEHFASDLLRRAADCDALQESSRQLVLEFQRKV